MVRPGAASEENLGLGVGRKGEAGSAGGDTLQESASRGGNRAAGAERQRLQLPHADCRWLSSPGCPPTLSVALPGSILNNAQSLELRTYLAGQIARACAIFCVDEVVVFDEDGEGVK